MSAAAAFVAALVSSPASAIVSTEVASTFDTDADDWTFVDVQGSGNYTNVLASPTAATHVATGGNPGGFITATDPSNNTFFFSAPAKFLGNQSAKYGGVLSFDIAVDPATPIWDGDPDVVLISDAGVLVYDIGNNPGTSFSARSVPWTQVGWRLGNLGGAPVSQAQFQQVIGNLGALMIAGEFVASTPGNPATFETASLDNVVLTPVPEPGMAVLMVLGPGLLGVGAVCGRKRVLSR